MSGVWNNGITSQYLSKTIRKMLTLPSNNSYEPVQQQIFIKPILASPTVRSSKNRMVLDGALSETPSNRSLPSCYSCRRSLCCHQHIPPPKLLPVCVCVDCQGELEFVRAIALIKCEDAEWYQDLARANPFGKHALRSCWKIKKD